MTNYLQEVLLNDYQRDFPLVSQPFLQIAKENETDASTIINLFKSLKADDFITRIGPVFRPNTIGVSTLAAMKVSVDRLEEVAEIVNQYSEVNHNYERGHSYNLWFVATASDKQHLENTLCDIEKNTGIIVMRLPMLKEFHIDLGFNMRDGANKHSSYQNIKKNITRNLPTDDIQQQLINEIQTGLPLTKYPYAAIASKLEVEEQEVIKRLKALLDTGVIRRMGVVVRHRKLGYHANAMVVWDFPDNQIENMGKTLSTIDCVTLCYQRPRHLPYWSYNLFTMIHGKNKQSVEQRIQDIIEEFDLLDVAKATLFSKRSFKQKGACYSYQQPETHFQRVSNV